MVGVLGYSLAEDVGHRIVADFPIIRRLAPHGRASSLALDHCKTQGEQFGNRLNVTQGTVKKIGITKLFDSRL